MQQEGLGKLKKEIITPGVQLGHLVPGRYKYWDLALQVSGVSDETVKYGREYLTSTQD
jgi:hypothetical protein